MANLFSYFLNRSSVYLACLVLLSMLFPSLRRYKLLLEGSLMFFPLISFFLFTFPLLDSPSQHLLTTFFSYTFYHSTPHTQIYCLIARFIQVILSRQWSNARQVILDIITFFAITPYGLYFTFFISQILEGIGFKFDTS